MSSLRSDKSDSSPTTRVGVFSDKLINKMSEAKPKGKTVKEVIVKLTLSGDLVAMNFNYDMTAYNADGTRAVAVYDDDTSLIEKVYHLVCIIKKGDVWEFVRIVIIDDAMDAVDVMSEVNSFLIYYKEK